MKYFIDGYNLLFRIKKEVDTPSFEKNRRFFIKELSSIFNVLDIDVTIVFDGKEEHLNYETRQIIDHVEILYTKQEETADLYLLNIAFSHQKELITIVTSDLVLAKQCRSAGVKTLKIEAFIHFLEKKLAKQKPVTKNRSNPSSSKEFSRYLAIFEKRLKKED